MKFNCSPTYEEKISRLEKWHDWFAWYPVKVASGDCRWLETTERRCIVGPVSGHIITVARKAKPDAR